MKEYFTKQLETTSLIDEKKFSELNGKSLYSNYKVGDKVLFFMKQEVNGTEINFILSTVVERELEKMAEDFNFVRMSTKMIPVFETTEKECIKK